MERDQQAKPNLETPVEGDIVMNKDEKMGAVNPTPTNIPMSEKPSSLEDALEKVHPISGANPDDVVTVYCTGGKKAHVLKYKDAKGQEVHVITCR